jgi:hypothetical protein
LILPPLPPLAALVKVPFRYPLLISVHPAEVCAHPTSGARATSSKVSAASAPRQEQVASLEPSLDRMAPAKAARVKLAARPRDDAPAPLVEAAMVAIMATPSAPRCAISLRADFLKECMPPHRH